MVNRQKITDIINDGLLILTRTSHCANLQLSESPFLVLRLYITARPSRKAPWVTTQCLLSAHALQPVGQQADFFDSITQRYQIREQEK